MSTEQTVPLVEGTEPHPSDASVHSMAMHPDGPAAPRTRWAAIIWGAFFAGLAWAGIWLLADTSRREAVVDWATELTAPAMGAVALLALGAVLLVSGIVGVLRHLQRRAAQRR